MLAHGKTMNEPLTIKFPKDTSRESIHKHMTSIKSKPFREASYELLKLFVDTARKIEKDIEKNGFYPNQDCVNVNLRERLCEGPLSVTGIRSW